MLASVALLIVSPLPAFFEHGEQWVASAIALAAAFVLWRLTIAAIDRFYARRFLSRFIPRVSTYTSLSKSLAGAVIFYLILIELLHIWSVNIAPALWSATIVSAAIAFGAQAIVRDVLTGIFFLFEDSYDVGDGVELMTTNGIVAGTVEAISLRITRVIDPHGRVVSIPNGSIVFVTNATRLPSRISLKITVPLRSDVQTLRRRLEEVATHSAPEAGVDPATLGVRFEDGGVDTLTLGVEFEASRPAARKAEAFLRERILTALQADGVLPGADPPASGVT
ncbi:MAG: mechanosensitive ion channel family protein [Candidatus Eremiobacteraeota bacterium]|nr:mechanosensitive ion channel family protein [Candidatus Eremiobacteraeota bacterium]